MQVNDWYRPKNHRQLIQKLEDWLPNKFMINLHIVIAGYQSSTFNCFYRKFHSLFLLS